MDGWRTTEHYAKHKNLEVSAGFYTETARDDYIKLSVSNGHEWTECGEDEAKSCYCYRIQED